MTLFSLLQGWFVCLFLMTTHQATIPERIVLHSACVDLYSNLPPFFLPVISFAYDGWEDSVSYRGNSVLPQLMDDNVFRFMDSMRSIEVFRCYLYSVDTLLCSCF